MRYLSLFSGIEAATVAWHPLGWECVAVAEIEPFPCAVLAHHYPTVPNLGDVSLVTEDQLKALGPIDLVVFGSPCQDLSVAGKRKGLAGERSGLFHIAMRIIGWARTNNDLRWALWENVPGAFSSNSGRDFAAVVEAMAGLAGVDVPPGGWGYEGAAVGQDGLVEWAVLDAQWFGVAQRRRRVFALSDFGDWASRCPVLLEPQGLRGDSAPSREAGQDIAGSLASRTTGGGFPGTDEACSGYVQPVRRSVNVCMSSGQANAEIRTDGGVSTLTCLHEAPIIASTLRGEGSDASEDGTGRGTPLAPVAFHPTQDPISSTDGTTHALGCGSSGGQASVAVAIQDVRGTDKAQNGRGWNDDGTAYTLDTHATQGVAICGAFFAGQGAKAGSIAYSTDIAPTLKASDSGTNRTPSVHINTHPVAFQPRHYSDRERMGGEPSDVCHTLSAQAGQGDSSPHIASNMQVRRLTPTECERLQGFPDDYTLVEWFECCGSRLHVSLGKYGCPNCEGQKVARLKQAADGPRYKALGNSMAVPVMRWIGERIDVAELMGSDKDTRAATAAEE